MCQRCQSVQKTRRLWRLDSRIAPGTLLSEYRPRSLELEHKSSRDFGAELVRREVVRSNHVAAYPYRPPSIVPPDIHSATHFVGKRCLGTKRRLRGKMRSSDERVSPEF